MEELRKSKYYFGTLPSTYFMDDTVNIYIINYIVTSIHNSRIFPVDTIGLFRYSEKRNNYYLSTFDINNRVWKHELIIIGTDKFNYAPYKFRNQNFKNLEEFINRYKPRIKFLTTEEFLNRLHEYNKKNLNLVQPNYITNLYKKVFNEIIKESTINTPSNIPLSVPSDIKITFKFNNGEKTYNLHNHILIQSDFFKTISIKYDENKIVNVDNYSENTFIIILEYLYTNEITSINKLSLEELQQLVDFYIELYRLSDYLVLDSLTNLLKPTYEFLINIYSNEQSGGNIPYFTKYKKYKMKYLSIKK